MKQKFFKLAEKIAELSPHLQHKLGAVIVEGNKIVSVGFNGGKTHPKSNSYNKVLHAEEQAILLAKRSLYNCEIYVFRRTKQGNLGMSMPCKSCFRLIIKSGIKTIHYTMDKNFYIKII